MPRVSVITPCYNSANYVKATLDSVRAQTFEGWEHVIVDDGSTDASAAVVAEATALDSRTRLVQQANGGVCAARNRGVLEVSSNSDYLLFLDADDVLTPAMLTRLVDHLDRNPSVGLAYCDLRLIDADGQLLPYERWTRRLAPSTVGVREIPPDEPETPFATVFGLSLIVPSLCLMRRSVYDQTPGWDESFGQHYEDSDLIFHMAIRSGIHFINERLVHHRRHPASSAHSIKPDRAEKQKEKLYAKWRSLSTLTPRQKATVRRAEIFVEGKLVPFRGMEAGAHHLLRGEVGKAARFYAGATKRFARSIAVYRSQHFVSASAAPPSPRSMPRTFFGY